MFGEDLWFKWWAMYPKKIAFKHTKMVWCSLSEEQKRKAISTLPLHVQLWKLEDRSVQYIPYPRSWLEGERWEDEIELPEPQGQQWWKSDQATMEYGRKKGIPAKPGMSMEQYRQMLRAA
jgi:hypothetical protein